MIGRSLWRHFPEKFGSRVVPGEPRGLCTSQKNSKRWACEVGKVLRSREVRTSGAEAF